MLKMTEERSGSRVCARNPEFGFFDLGGAASCKYGFQSVLRLCRWLGFEPRRLRQEIADTVANPDEAESELRFLAAVLARK